MTNIAEDAVALDAYIRAGAQKAIELGNRGPIKFNADGTLYEEIRDAYNRYGFYVFEGVLNAAEIKELRADFEEMLERAPYTKDAKVDAQGRPALGVDFTG